MCQCMTDASPFPLTVMGVRVVDALGTRFPVREGAARTDETAAKAAMVVKVFMLIDSKRGDG